ARVIHFLEAQLAEIVEALLEGRGADDVAALEGRDQLAVPIVLFQGNDLRPRGLTHGVFLQELGLSLTIRCGRCAILRAPGLLPEALARVPEKWSPVFR